MIHFIYQYVYFLLYAQENFNFRQLENKYWLSSFGGNWNYRQVAIKSIFKAVSHSFFIFMFTQLRKPCVILTFPDSCYTSLIPGWFISMQRHLIFPRLWHRPRFASFSHKSPVFPPPSTLLPTRASKLGPNSQMSVQWTRENKLEQIILSFSKVVMLTGAI